MPMLAPLKKRFVAGYILLVGAPLLVLMGNLHLGRRLSAPVAVYGVWDIATPISAAWSCFDSPASLKGLALTVTQSGRTLMVSTSSDPSDSVAGEVRGKAVNVPSLHLWPKTWDTA